MADPSIRSAAPADSAAIAASYAHAPASAALHSRCGFHHAGRLHAVGRTSGQLLDLQEQGR